MYASKLTGLLDYYLESRKITDLDERKKITRSCPFSVPWNPMKKSNETHTKRPRCVEFVKRHLPKRTHDDKRTVADDDRQGRPIDSWSMRVVYVCVYVTGSFVTRSGAGSAAATGPTAAAQIKYATTNFVLQRPRPTPWPTQIQLFGSQYVESAVQNYVNSSEKQRVIHARTAWLEQASQQLLNNVHNRLQNLLKPVKS